MTGLYRLKILDFSYGIYNNIKKFNHVEKCIVKLHKRCVIGQH